MDQRPILHVVRKRSPVLIVLILAVAVLLVMGVVLYRRFVPRGGLPSEYAMVRMMNADLKRIVLELAPLGTSESDVEHLLKYEWRWKWEVNSKPPAELLSEWFHVQISDGDHYIRSIFDTIGIWPMRVIVYFLFDVDGRLKDVKVQKKSATL